MAKIASAVGITAGETPVEQAPVLALYTRAIEELARRDGIPLADGVQAFRDAEARGVAPDRRW